MEPPEGGLVRSGTGQRGESWRFLLCPGAAEGGGSAIRSRLGGLEWGWLPEYPVSSPERSREEAGRRARRQVRQYGAANRLNRLGTLTYAPPGCYDPAQVREDVGAFWKALRRFLGQRFPYVWVPEWHPGGHGLHVHFAVGQFVPRAAIERAWGHGFISIKLLGDLPVGSGGLAESRLAARYLGKYLAKDFAGPAAGKVRPGLHRYEVAQGFQPSRLAILGQSEASVLAGASEIMHGPPAKSWHSQESEGWSGPPSLWAAWDR